jgi:hypothetical protein
MSTLFLYRRLLRAASSFPSKNRTAILEDIRTSFRSNKNETDKQKLEKQFEEAYAGLAELEKFQGMRKDAHWSYSQVGGQ